MKFKAAESSTFNETFQRGELKWFLRIIMSCGFHGLDRSDALPPIFSLRFPYKPIVIITKKQNKKTLEFFWDRIDLLIEATGFRH